MTTYRKIRQSAVVLSILSYFFCFAGRGLQADLSHDDLMNLYKCWYPPASQHLAEVIAFFTYSESFRPMGSLFYRLLFEIYGFQALPYRIACYGLLLANIWLAYSVVRRLTNSREVAVITALLFAYHRGFWILYINTGMCFDLLCFCRPDFSKSRWHEVQPCSPKSLSFNSNDNVLSLKIVKQILCGYALPSGFPNGR